MQEGGDFILGDGALVQGRGEKRAHRARIGDGFKVADVAQAARGVDAARPGSLYDACHAFDVRTVAGTNAVETHGDNSLRPMRCLRKERRKPARSFGVVVERQKETLAEGAAQLLPIFEGGQAFAADHERCPERQPESAIGDVGKSCVDPKLVAWKGAGEIATKLEMIADACDGIEVGDVERGRPRYVEESAGDRDRILG